MRRKERKRDNRQAINIMKENMEENGNNKRSETKSPTMNEDRERKYGKKKEKVAR